MPRPRKGVTFANLHLVDSYFQNAIKLNRLSTNKSIEHLGFMYDAKEAFKALPIINWKDSTSKKDSLLQRKEALQAWIDKYITPDKWQRCLLTLRQNKSRKKLKLRRLDIKIDVYLAIKALAKKQGLSMGETIYNLAKPKLDKLYKMELAKELQPARKK